MESRPTRSYRNIARNYKSRIPAGTEEAILMAVGVISCFSGFILNGDQTLISVLNQDITNSTYTWLSNIAVFFGSPLIFFSLYVLSEGIYLPKKYIIGVLVLYSIFIGFCGYLITQDQGTIFDYDKDKSSNLFKAYGWITLVLGVLMFLYGGFLAYV